MPPRPKVRSAVEYVLTKGCSTLLELRVPAEAVRLYVNGPAMLFGSARILSSLDMADGATFDAWSSLATSLSCTSFCGQNGITDLPVEVITSRIGTHLEFSLGPMAMYQSTVVVRPTQVPTLLDAIDAAFGKPEKRYSVVMVPEPATGHAEHDATIFGDALPDHGHLGHGDHEKGHDHG